MNRKGFTLIELLAVIVILAIIALIAVPAVINIIEDSRKSAVEESGRNIARAAETYYMQGVMKGETPSSIDLTTDILKYNGDKPEKGILSYDETGRAYIKMYMNGYCVVVDVDNSAKAEKKDKDDCKLNMVLLSIDAKGGEVSEVSREYDSGDTIGELPTPTREGYTFKGWILSNGTTVTSETVITENMTINASWEANTYEVTFNRTKFDNGEAVYFNPTTGLACEKEEIVSSTTGTKDGCMKWYAFLDSESNTTVKLLLDHNTTGYVAWNSNTSGTTAETALSQLSSDVNSWDTSIKSTARLISASEVNQIAPTTEEYIWSPIVYVSGYYLHTGNQVEYTGPIGSNKYAWLFDNTSDCEARGCNIEQNNTAGYWTSDYSWLVSMRGYLGSDAVNSTRGVRPVIEVSKELFKETKEVTYDSAYGELPELEKHGYIFLGWTLSDGTLITNETTLATASNHTLYAKWQKAEVVYPDGYAVLYDPVNNTKCDTSIGSTTGTNDGCMKWYVFLDNNTSKTVKLILDHNTTAKVAWNSDSTGTTPVTALVQLGSDVANWNDAVKSTARLIRAEEVNQIAPAAASHIWNINDENTWYYLHNGLTGTENRYEGLIGTNKYAWLFDNTAICEIYGCNVVDADTYGYWTSTYANNSIAWNVYHRGGLGNIEVDDNTYGGIRPVITVSKDVFK